MKQPKFAMYRPHKRVLFETDGPSRTRQEFQDECDINKIMARYQKTGVLQHVNRNEPQYIDFTGAPDFMSAMNLMHEASDAFARLPAQVRKRFHNDPAEFVEFAENAENIQQLRDWGLAKPLEVPPAPTKVEVVNPVPEPSKGS